MIVGARSQPQPKVDEVAMLKAIMAATATLSHMAARHQLRWALTVFACRCSSSKACTVLALAAASTPERWNRASKYEEVFSACVALKVLLYCASGS